jgi:hypothetical protein
MSFAQLIVQLKLAELAARKLKGAYMTMGPIIKSSWQNVKAFSKTVKKDFMSAFSGKFRTSVVRSSRAFQKFFKFPALFGNSAQAMLNFANRLAQKGRIFEKFVKGGGIGKPISPGFSGTSVIGEKLSTLERFKEFIALRKSRRPQGAPTPPQSFGGMNLNAKLLSQGVSAALFGGAGSIGARLASIPGGAGAGIAGLAGGVAKTPFKASGAFFKGAGKMFGKMAGLDADQMKAAGDAFESFGDVGKAAAMAAIAQAGLTLLAALNPFKPLFEALVTIFTIWGQILGDSFTPLIEELFEVLLSEEVLNTVQELGALFTLFIGEALSPLLPLLPPLGEAFIALVTAFLPLVPIIMPFIELALNLLIPALNLMAFAFSILMIPLELLLLPLAFLAESLNALFLGLKGGDQVLADIEAGFINILNGIIGGLNALDVLDVVPDIPSIPSAATGALVKGPQLVMVGDNPSGVEEIIPSESPRFGGGGGGGPTVIINGFASERALADLDRKLTVHRQQSNLLSP